MASKYPHALCVMLALVLQKRVYTQTTYHEMLPLIDYCTFYN